MDIIDILMARKAAQGQAAAIMSQAQAALQEATDAADSITSMSSAIETYGEQAQSAYDRATAAADIYDNLIAITDQSIIEDLAALLSEQMLDATIASIEVASGTVEGAATKNIVATKYGGNTTTLEVERNYTTTGQNTDGSMTQKAITDALQSVQVNLGSNNSDKLVKVGNNGELVVSSIDEDDVLNGNIHVDPTNPDTPEEFFMNDGTLGLHLNYKTSTYTPTDNAVSATTADFNSYAMYGGRKRCLVDNNGTIIAFCGDSDYTDTPTNGYQVMVYQPKFYYKRIPVTIESVSNGAAIREEIIKVSEKQKDGFKIHPAFINSNGQELNYILISAYEGSIQTVDSQESYKDITYNNFTNQLLASVSDAKPVSTYENDLNCVSGQHMANNRGSNWHMLTSKVYALQELLQMIEMKSPEVQSKIGMGIVNISHEESQYDVSLCGNTGATKDLGNVTGQAASTTFYMGGSNIKTKTNNDTRSITYRGVENPYGNGWKILGDMLYSNNKIYMNNNYQYSTTSTNNYVNCNITIPSSNNFISAFNYNSTYDWLFTPIEAATTADALAPIGDALYTGGSSNMHIISIGGGYETQSKGGIFCLNSRRDTFNIKYKTQLTRLIYVPNLSDSNYQSNIAKWRLSIGG